MAYFALKAEKAEEAKEGGTKHEASPHELSAIMGSIKPGPLAKRRRKA